MVVQIGKLSGKCLRYLNVPGLLRVALCYFTTILALGRLFSTPCYTEWGFTVSMSQKIWINKKFRRVEFSLALSFIDLRTSRK